MSFSQGISGVNQSNFASSIGVTATPAAANSTMVLFPAGGTPLTLADNVAGNPNTYNLQQAVFFNGSTHHIYWYDCPNFQNPGGGSVTWTYDVTSATTIELFVCEIASSTAAYASVLPGAGQAVSPNAPFTTTGASPAAVATAAGQMAIAAFASSGPTGVISDAAGWNNLLQQIDNGASYYPGALSSILTSGAGSYSDSYAVTGTYSAGLITVIYGPTTIITPSSYCINSPMEF